MRKRQLLSFFALAYAIAWAFWLPAAASSESSPSGLALLLVPLGSFAPALSAAIVMALARGRPGVRELLGGLLRWRVGRHWYLVVFLGPLLVVVAAEVLDGLLGARGLEFGGPQIPLELPWYLLLPALVPAFFVVLLFGGPLGEEIGWRGYALPRLQERYSAFVASLLLGAAWALWHLPLFFITGTSQSLTPLVPFLVSVVALAVLFTWVFNGTSGSLLVAVLLHGTVNFSAGVLSILPSEETGDTQPFLLSVGLTLLAATAVVLTQGPARLSRGAKVLSSETREEPRAL